MTLRFLKELPLLNIENPPNFNSIFRENNKDKLTSLFFLATSESIIAVTQPRKFHCLLYLG